MKIFKWIIGILVVILLVSLFSGGDDKSSVQTDGPIKIGFIGPLSGDAATYGEELRNAAILAENELNTNGTNIEIIYEDGKCNGKDAASAAQKLINVDRVDVIVGGLCSGETLAIAPIAESTKTPLISPASSSPDITEAGDFTFRAYPSDSITGEVIANSLNNEGIKKLAIYAENTEYAIALRDSMMSQFSDDMSIVVNEVYNSDTLDFKTSLLKISDPENTHVIVLPQSGASVVQIVKQARELEITSQFYTALVVGDEVVKSGPEVNGMVIFDNPSLNEFQGTVSFLSLYQEVYDTDPTFGLFASLSYDTIKLVYETLSEVGNDGEAVRDYWYKLDSYPGTAYDISFDENGDVEARFDLIKYQIQDNALVKIN